MNKKPPSVFFSLIAKSYKTISQVRCLPEQTLRRSTLWRTEQMGKSVSVQSQVTTSEGKCLFYLVPPLYEFEAEFPCWLPDLAHLLELKA